MVSNQLILRFFSGGPDGITAIGSQYVVRLDAGEEIIASLKQLCLARGICSAWVMGIGAVSQATIGFFDLASREYRPLELSTDHEITSLMGNISTLEGEVFLHLHVTLSGVEGQVRGGHLFSAVISAAGEIVLGPLEGILERKYFAESELRLLALEGNEPSRLLGDDRMN